MKSRLEMLGKALGVSMRQFGLTIGRSGGWVNSLAQIKSDSINTQDLTRILEAYPNANVAYILTGKGSPVLEDTLEVQDYAAANATDSPDYKELCIAYRQDLADAREEIRKLRESYFQLLDTNNHLMAEVSKLQMSLIQSDAASMFRDRIETKTPQKRAF